MLATEDFNVETAGQGDICDISQRIADAVSDSGLSAGVVTATVIGSTAALTTIEFEPGAVTDLGTALERLAPRHGVYQHHQRWGDDNGSSHVRAALLGPSITLPFIDRQVQVGSWQQIVLAEFDTKSRHRRIVVQMLGE